MTFKIMGKDILLNKNMEEKIKKMSNGCARQ